MFYNPYSIFSQHGILGINDPILNGIFSIVISLAVTLLVGALFYKYEYKIDNLLDWLFHINKKS